MSAKISMPGHNPIELTRSRYVLGRGEDCAILLPEDDGRVSREHAVLERDIQNIWSIADLQSRNGTLVNGRPIGGRYVLRDGDSIQAGGTTIRFDAAPTIVAQIYEPLAVAQSGREAASSAPAAPARERYRESVHELPASALPVQAEGTHPISALAIPPPTAKPKATHRAAASRGPAGEAADRGSTMVRSGVISAITIIMLAALFMPWITVKLWFFTGQISYMNVVSFIAHMMAPAPSGLLQSTSGIDSLASSITSSLRSGAMQDTSVIEAIVVLSLPGIGMLLSFASLLARSRARLQGGLLIAGGVVGALGSSIIFYYLQSSLLIDLASMLGAGYAVFSALSVAAAAVGACIYIAPGKFNWDPIARRLHAP